MWYSSRGSWACTAAGEEAQGAVSGLPGYSVVKWGKAGRHRVQRGMQPLRPMALLVWPMLIWPEKKWSPEVVLRSWTTLLYNNNNAECC